MYIQVAFCDFMIWAMSWENLFMPYANNKAQISLRIRAVWSAPLLFAVSSFYIRNFKPLASFCGCAGWFESYLIENTEDGLSGPYTIVNAFS